MNKKRHLLGALLTALAITCLPASFANADCNDGIPDNSPTKECDPEGGMFINGDPNGTPCSTGNDCTFANTCCKFNCQFVGTPGIGCTGVAATDCTGSGLCEVNNGICGPGAALPNGTNCADGTFCDGVETCQGGVCTAPGDPCAGGATCQTTCNEASDTCNTPNGTSCPDASVCVSDSTCDGAGSCVGTPNSSPCDDGVFCNGDDTCSGGTCSVHDGDPCTGGGECGDTCDEGGDTCDSPAATPCDGNEGECFSHACDGAGTCVDTPLTAGTTCTDDGEGCTDDECDGAGVCAHPGNTDPCSDGIFCNGTDTCADGTCSSHTGDPCEGADGDANCSESCYEIGQACINPDPDESACNDGLACNGADTCQSGSCSNHAGDPCAGGSECANSCAEDDGGFSCNVESGVPCTADENVCTDEQCDGAGACGSVPNAEPCDDGLFCNGLDTCADSSCSEHGIDPCFVGGECADSCDEETDNCNDAAGTPCSADENLCTDEECDGSGECGSVPNDDPCEDGLFCNGADTCSDGGCNSHVGDPCTAGEECADACSEDADSCNDTTGTPCTADENVCDDETCDGAGACGSSPNDDPCNDGVFCNGTDTCSDGGCNSHDGDPCLAGEECADACSEGTDSCNDGAGTPCTADGNLCTDEECNGAGACAPVNNTDPCNDGVFCNGADTCAGGTCAGHAGNPCPGPDGDGNCAETCNEVAGDCSTPDTNGSVCDDGLFCNGDGDTCSGGTCSVHEGSPCNDGNSCTTDTCDEKSGCDSEPIDDDSPCDDGDACTVADTCVDNSCAGESGVLGDLCPWTLVVQQGTKPDSIKAKFQVDVEGDACTGILKLGSTTVQSDAVAASTSSKAVRLGPTALVGDDIVSGGGGAKALPGTAKLPYTDPPVSKLAPLSTTAKSDASGDYDLSGTHPLVAACNAARTSYDDVAAELDGLPSTDSIPAPVRLKAGTTLTITPTVVGGLNVVDIPGKVKAAKNANIEVSGGGNPDTVVVIRIASKLLMALQTDIVLTNQLTADHLLIYVKGKKCLVSDLATGAGTLLCTPGKVKLNRDVQWDGTIYGSSKVMKLGDHTDIDYVPFQGF